MNADDLKRIRRVQLKMDRLATDLLAGIYRSAFKGRGMEFEEVRSYQVGDEVRSIDWNVTARMGTPFVKVYREERELTVMLLVDISASNRFGSENALKSSVLSEIGAVLAFSGIKNSDKIGLILFSDRKEQYLPPAKGIRHVLRLIRDLMAFPSIGQGTKIEAALHFLGKVQKKKCVVFLLSDFLSGENIDHEIALIAMKHDLIAICVSDPLESHLPNVGLLPVQDLETLQQDLVDTASPQLNQRLQDRMKELQGAAHHSIQKSGGAWISVSTATPYIIPLRHFLMKRGVK